MIDPGSVCLSGANLAERERVMCWDRATPMALMGSVGERHRSGAVPANESSDATTDAIYP
jgi:hypothetical protein